MRMQLIMLLEPRTAVFPCPDYFIGPLIKKRKKSKTFLGVIKSSANVLTNTTQINGYTKGLETRYFDVMI